MKQNRSKTKTVVRVIAFLLVAALLYGRSRACWP